jgi:hypothetical protein
MNELAVVDKGADWRRLKALVLDSVSPPITSGFTTWAWMSSSPGRLRPAGIAEGPVFRSVNRGGQVRETALSETVLWQLIRPYAEAAGVAGIALHDCRRTCAKLCRAA